MLIIKGVNVYPSQIESIVMETEGVGPHYQLIVSQKGYLDDLEVQVELSGDKFTGKFKELEDIETLLRQRIQRDLGFSTRVKLVEPRSLERTKGKATRVIDLRAK